MVLVKSKTEDVERRSLGRLVEGRARKAKGEEGDLLEE